MPLGRRPNPPSGSNPCGVCQDGALHVALLLNNKFVPKHGHLVEGVEVNEGGKRGLAIATVLDQMRSSAGVNAVRLDGRDRYATGGIVRDRIRGPFQLSHNFLEEFLVETYQA